MNLPFELYVAIRYLLARRRQAFVAVISAVSTIGVAVGVMALVVALALMTGMQQELRDRIIGSAAHVYVYKVIGGGFVDYQEEIEKLKGQASTHFWPHSRRAGDMSEDTGVKLVTKAEGVWVEDAEGERWLDMMAGMWLKNIGHGRKEIADAVYQQMTDISYSPGGSGTVSWRWSAFLAILVTKTVRTMVARRPIP